MTRSSVRLVLCLALVAGVAACEDDTTDVDTFTLTFSGDDTFHGAHGDQAIEVALVRSSDGAVIATRNGTVSGEADPSFSFTFANALEAGTAYEVHYWIDSNFQGGDVGECGPPDDDHQWNIDIGTATADIDHEETHLPADREPVCDTFD